MYYHEAYIYSQTPDGFMETGKATTEGAGMLLLYLVRATATLQPSATMRSMASIRKTRCKCEIT
jgi:hypothetical protein